MLILLQKIFNQKYEPDLNIQKAYEEKIVKKVSTNTIKCPYCGGHEFILKGSYKRNILVHGNVETISIHRIKCKHCKKTHALFSIEIIPYCYINANDALKYLKNEIVEIDEELIKLEFLKNMKRRKAYLLQKYLHELNLDFEKQDLSLIDEYILKAENKLFMQIHQGKVFKIELSP